MTFEYGVNIQRNFPWEGVVDPPFGNSWAIVDPGMQAETNAHDEAEVFIVVKGHGLMEIGDERRELEQGDIVYVPPLQAHTLTNSGDQELLVLSIWWIPNGTPAEK